MELLLLSCGGGVVLVDDDDDDDRCSEIGRVLLSLPLAGWACLWLVPGFYNNEFTNTRQRRLSFAFVGTIILLI